MGSSSFQFHFIDGRAGTVLLFSSLPRNYDAISIVHSEKNMRTNNRLVNDTIGKNAMKTGEETVICICRYCITPAVTANRIFCLPAVPCFGYFPVVTLDNDNSGY